jgi:radical SAM superfamily enzyme YgiQ (UPF0313 family)
MRILLITKDTKQYTDWFPQGIAYIAAILLREGYEVEIYHQNMNHYPCEHLTAYLDKNHFDIVGLGAIGGYYQYKMLFKISEAINKSKQRPFYMIGGHCPSPEPEYFLKKTKADVVVIGEGEITVIELLDAVANRKSLSHVKGIAYWEDENIVVNKERPLIQDIDTIPFPEYHLFPINYYRLIRPMPGVSKTDFVLPVLSGRGCTFKCTFCYRMDDGFRQRSNENIIEEVSLLKKDYGITYVIFSDELLMSSKERTISLCDAFLKANLNISWNCNGRLNYAKPDVLKLMKRAGCVFINYGIEAMDDLVLKNMNKGLTTKQIIEGVENTLSIGISPGLNILFGNIGDNKETLDKGVEFLLNYDNGAQLRTIKPVTPYPGSPLYYYAIKKGFIKDCEDFYKNRHTNSDLLTANFTNLGDEEFYKCLLEANSKLIKNYYKKQLSRVLDSARRLYLESDSSFRGFRQR